MGVIRNLLEPAAIVVVFTTGTLINRRRYTKLRDIPCVETPLLKNDCEEEKPRSLKGRPNIQTRILAHFPFLIEIWYWLLTYWIYQGLRAISARVISDDEAVFELAQHHAQQILGLEHVFHIDVELAVQQFVLNRVPWLTSFLARVYYSHIVLGVIFLVYGYTFFQRDRYQEVRRTLALENVIAFAVLTLWRCSPPRLLPEVFGFIDVLHSNTAGSAWTQNKFQLTIAAMPSLHFGNSVLIALCLLRHSPHWPIRCIAPIWPIMMGLTIVATANHFILDAVVGVCVTLTAYWFNHVMLVLLPVERVLFRLLRIEKPVP
ncbi:phosphatase PAP2 family protein [Aspergillus clavatus NRRL 1]|uniref:Inositolphosphotransferase Aur1/Ipt1 domain-containing protein n=1 Tax=Aspergillus clavatus (strain ATCC 1007 / CBS 513.65 / DSM 816 / NCTC 3887 / NRRL 1 / QM 1276 / 107) TaxID=344612 RepID=A1CDK3_ASPCL|nr:uncharacterized protein ACLA_006880 [Aspergillus clavatus NRRL 1]EAW11930.1 conserved hypothetical protein [Aspergillus clavatus NRRL 1]